MTARIDLEQTLRDKMPRRHDNRIRVAVLFGGRSPEHSISCASAEAVIRTLRPDRYEVIAIRISSSGAWTLAPGAGRGITEDGQSDRRRRQQLILSGNRLIALHSAGGWRELSVIDVVFPLLHGPYGEDGTVQGLLELSDVPYVGSGVLASAVCMDKDFSKRLLRDADLPVSAYAVVPPGLTLSPDDQQRLGLPAFVKPAQGGSSLGITRITSWSQLPTALRIARKFDRKALVEAHVAGRELACGVLEGKPGEAPEVSEPAEALLGNHQWYDFEAKYLDDACEMVVPAELPAHVIAESRELAQKAFATLGCAGLARVDFFVDTENKLTINEVNTMPGFTQQSFFPMVWAYAGLSFAALVDRLIDTALTFDA